MESRKHYLEKYNAAMKRERDLWAKIAARGPSLPEHDDKLWREWLEAVGRSTTASKELREASARDAASGGAAQE